MHYKPKTHTVMEVALFALKMQNIQSTTELITKEFCSSPQFFGERKCLAGKEQVNGFF